MKDAASDPALLAQTRRNYLVLKGAPFRQGHEIVCKLCARPSILLKHSRRLPLKVLKSFQPFFAERFLCGV